MARAVEHAIESDGTLIVEAGTGTGKTLAYLTPAILAGRKTVVSTGTRNLQSQLFNKDLPLARLALRGGLQTALLKGRRNYLCPYRMALSQECDVYDSRRQAREMETIASWAVSTATGDCSEVAGVPEDSPVWQLVTSTSDNCLGRDCPEAEKCPVLRARREALDADLVVINHHLLFADAVLREDGFGELLPEAEVFILDEAHQLPETAANFFGESVSARQINDLAKDALSEATRDASDDRGLREACETLERNVMDLRLAMGGEIRREAWDVVGQTEVLQRSMSVLRDNLGQVGEALNAAAQRGQGLAKCSERASALQGQFKAVFDQDHGEGIRWFETWARTFSIHVTPVSAAEPFSELMQQRGGSWIFTSATLAVGDDFSHFTKELGIDPKSSEALRLDSPFDYENQAVLYSPRHLPDPGSQDFNPAFAEMCIPVLEASRGRAFVLFTSYRAMHQSAEILRERLDFPMFMQGECGKARLLEKFLEAENSVLLATGSFWEGVDVRGDALSCVIIDRLPFASPGEPVLKARLAQMRKEGLDPFRSYQLPRAAIALKQGVGRLIRDAGDRGVLVVADPRLVGRPYGEMFLDSIPDMPRTRDLERVRKFFGAEGA